MPPPYRGGGVITNKMLNIALDLTNANKIVVVFEIIKITSTSHAFILRSFLD